MKKISKLSIFNIIFFGIIIIASIILTVILKLSAITLLSCISGILYMVFLSERNFLNFIIGFISSTTYIIVAFASQLYGEVIFYLLFDLPMIFVSYFTWIKHKDTKITVYTEKLSLKRIFLIGITSCIAILIYGSLLKVLGDVSPFIDATSTVVSLIATILMALRYREQWFMWVVVYVVSIILWIDTFDLLMLIMSCCCFISCFIGYFNWSRHKRNNKLN